MYIFFRTIHNSPTISGQRTICPLWLKKYPFSPIDGIIRAFFRTFGTQNTSNGISAFEKTTSSCKYISRLQPHRRLLPHGAFRFRPEPTHGRDGHAALERGRHDLHPYFQGCYGSGNKLGAILHNRAIHSKRQSGNTLTSHKPPLVRSRFLYTPPVV